jgi:hypothetical protein
MNLRHRCMLPVDFVFVTIICTHRLHNRFIREPCPSSIASAYCTRTGKENIDDVTNKKDIPYISDVVFSRYFDIFSEREFYDEKYKIII